ncbi:MAG: hypothetical protein LKG27_07620 [Clostridiaceae bacterium]|jgi:hypothetical protein|nr:hypothetical protein [Clostridiaceae bacterium]
MMQPISSTPYPPVQQNGYNPAQLPQPSYNAVKIDIHNPSVNAPGQQQTQPQYAPVTNPYYNYPQSSLYSYPQGAQPTYNMPSTDAINNADVAAQQAQALLASLAAQKAAQQASAPTIQQQNINAPVAAIPAPQITETKPTETKATTTAPQNSTTKAPEIVPPTPATPQIDLNSFIARLSNKDYEVQAAAMEEIANMVKDEPQKATELLDEKVVKSLQDIIKADSSKLQGPTAAQIAARQKLMAGQKLNDAENKLANTITPMEQAERNKSYAMFTTAIMQKLYGEEVNKLANTTVPLTELPGAVNIVEQLKDNPNPMVRTSAIEALSYIQQPAYKEDLKTLFQIAKNDKDKNVQEAAKVALSKLDAMTGATAQQAQPQAVQTQPAKPQPTAKTVAMQPQTAVKQAA